MAHRGAKGTIVPGTILPIRHSTGYTEPLEALGLDPMSAAIQRTAFRICSPTCVRGSGRSVVPTARTARAVLLGKAIIAAITLAVSCVGPAAADHQFQPLPPDQLPKGANPFAQFDPDYVPDLGLVRSLAVQGKAIAENNLGVMYYKGQGTPQDYAEAAKWYALAANQGDSAAQNNLGSMYRAGYGVRQDFVEAVKWFREAADQGNPDAQSNLGMMYDLGLGVAKDYAEAMRLYRLAAGQTNAAGEYGVGTIYFQGDGVPQSDVEAAKWFGFAGENGYAPAEAILGFLFQSGRGVSEDFVEAVKWFRLAANQGDATGQFYLGLAYWSGQGVPKDNLLAYMWLNLAVANGHQHAGARRDSVAAEMTPEQIAEAQKMATEWKPKM